MGSAERFRLVTQAYEALLRLTPKKSVVKSHDIEIVLTLRESVRPRTVKTVTVVLGNRGVAVDVHIPAGIQDGQILYMAGCLGAQPWFNRPKHDL